MRFFFLRLGVKADHLHRGRWNSQPSDPTLGHAVERSWCAMMRCSDVEMALKCQGDNESNPAFCQCLDETT